MLLVKNNNFPNWQSQNKFYNLHCSRLAEFVRFRKFHIRKRAATRQVATGQQDGAK